MGGTARLATEGVWLLLVSHLVVEREKQEQQESEALEYGMCEVKSEEGCSFLDLAPFA